MTKISIIVPVYNAEKYIGRCLHSLINQTLKDIEIIVIDDGSKDNTNKILQKYKDRIKIIKQKNSGVATARNKGLEIATGEYIYFVDSDDWIEKDTLEKLYSKAIDNNYDCVMCNFWYINDNKKWSGVVTNKKDILTAGINEYLTKIMFPVINTEKSYKTTDELIQDLIDSTIKNHKKYKLQHGYDEFIEKYTKEFSSNTAEGWVVDINRKNLGE